MLTSSSLIPNDIHGNKPWKIQKVELSSVIFGKVHCTNFFFDQFETNLLQIYIYGVIYVSPRTIFFINKIKCIIKGDNEWSE